MALLLSIGIHGGLGAIWLVSFLLQLLVPPEPQPAPPAPVGVTIVDEQEIWDEALAAEAPPEEEEAPPEEPAEPERPPTPHGQIVETPKPDVEVRPEKAEYLAEHNNKVEEESRSEDYRVNPEVLSDMYSPEDQLQYEDTIDLNVTEPSTGAKAGGEEGFDPNRDGPVSKLPPPFSLSNKDGLASPVPASSRTASLAGAPSNDVLNEARGDRTRLNTVEWMGASYVNIIRRMVQFYWSQNLDNLPSSLRLARPKYETTVEAVLDKDGALVELKLKQDSGSPPIDEAVIQAFRIAAPFPAPPAQLVASDGQVYLPTMTFEVNVGRARSPYVGVDPRQGVQFPGILKSPR